MMKRCNSAAILAGLLLLSAAAGAQSEQPSPQEVSLDLLLYLGEMELVETESEDGWVGPMDLQPDLFEQEALVAEEDGQQEPKEKKRFFLFSIFPWGGHQ